MLLNCLLEFNINKIQINVFAVCEWKFFLFIFSQNNTDKGIIFIVIYNSFIFKFVVNCIDFK